MHIAIAGNIGSGKTTLTRLLSKHYNWTPFYESVEDNPYLNDFYTDMKRWSFNLQIFFLNNRFKQIVELKKLQETVIQDRTIYEDAYIFAPNLYEMGLLSKRDFDNYFNLFKLMMSFIQAPDLLIYLKSSISHLINQIQKRGREYENSIRLDYLKKLDEKYNTWIENYKEGNLLVVNVDNYDFQTNKKDLSYIIDKIDAKYFGLFK